MKKYYNPGIIGIPNFLLKQKDLSPGAKLCFGGLGYISENSKILAKELGLTEDQVKKYCKELDLFLQKTGMIKLIGG